MKLNPLAIDLLRIDGGTQSRIAINEDAVDDYAELITESSEWPFPPLDVFHDGTDYFIADGFHRYLGAKRGKRGSIPCNVYDGTAKDAHIFGMTANDRHGMRMTRADKRACVEWLLDNGGKMTQAEIAEKAGVTVRTVKMIVADRNPVSIVGKVKPPKRECKGQTSPSIPSRGENATSGDSESVKFPPQDAVDAGIMPPPAKPDYGKCPNCAGTKWDEDEDGVSCSKCHHPYGEPVGNPDSKTKTKRQVEVSEAKQVLKTWMDAIGRWMNGKPDGIDSYRDTFPGPKGDRTIDAAKEFFNAISEWRKVLK